MPEGYIQHGGSRREYRCEFERTLKGEYCREDGEVRLDGLALCNRHAERLRLAERVTYWQAMLAHVELWSWEASSTGREDLARLLEIEGARASSELGHVSEEIEELEDVRHGETGSDGGRVPPPWRRAFLLSL